MKIAVLIGVLALVSLVLLMWRSSSHSNESREISFTELNTYLYALKNSTDPDAFLIITVARTENFFQFKRLGEGLEVDFPLVTERQKTKEALVREAYKVLGLDVRETRSTSGDRFLDASVLGTATQVHSQILKLYQQVFNIEASSRLQLEWCGLSISPQPTIR